MTMRRIIGITAAALLLVGVGVAVAQSERSIKQVSATLAATAASDVRTSTCTGPDGKTYTKTHGTYTGATAGGDWGANAPVRIHASSLINSDGDGVVEGRLRIEAADGRHVHAHFTTVYSDGPIAGLAQGHASSPGGKLIANFSADSYSGTGGFTNVKVGGGTTGGYAVLITRGGCRPGETPKPKPEKIEARGAITELPAGAIKVAGVTCTVPSDLASTVAKFKVGDYVRIKCEVANGATTLTRISGRHDKADRDDKDDDRRDKRSKHRD
jgi:hypothetical protein